MNWLPWIVLINVIATTFMSILSAIATVIANSCIQGELALTNPQAQWLTIFYLLGITTTVPAANWFGERFGLKTMYSIAVLIFTTGAGLAGTAESFLVIGTARAIEGIGAGFIFPIGLSLVAQSFPKPRLGIALNLYIGCGFAGGLGFGLPLAGYLSQFFSWRYIFLGMIPIGILAFISCWMIHKETKKDKTKPFDFWGFILFGTFISSLLTALTFGPILSTDAGWRSPWILGGFAIAAISIFTTVYVEKNHPFPILPLTLFKNIDFLLGITALFLMGMAFFASVSVTADYMLNALHYDKFTTGKIAMTYGLTMGVVGILTSFLIRRIPIAFLTLSGLSLIVFSYFLNNILDWQTGPTQVLSILFLRGAGMGLALGPTTAAAMRTVPPEMTNVAAALLTFFRQVGGAYGGTLISIVSIKRTIYHTARFSEQANEQLPAYQVALQRIATRFTHLDGQEGLAQAKQVLRANLERQAYIQGQNDAFIIFGYVVGSVVLLLLFFNLRNWWKGRIASNLKSNT